MTLATLVRRNLRRRLRRTLLTTLGMAVAIFLFVTLRSVLTTLHGANAVGSESRLVISNKLGIIFPLPRSYLPRLESTDGVSGVTYASWFGGVYIDERNFFANFAVDADTYLDMYPEMVLPADQRAAFLRERNAAVVGEGLVARFGWKLGQTVTLRGTIWPGEWSFVIRGIYSPARKGVDRNLMLFHSEYLENANPQADGIVGWYVLGLDDPQQAPAIAAAIDRQYENSSSPTRSQTERAFQLGFVGLYGNIGFFLNAIGMAVVFAILLVAANTMAMSARERFGEVAILKTLGFTDATVLRLVLAESATISAIGLALGLGGALLLFNLTEFDAGGFLPGMAVTPGTIALAVLIGAGIAAISGAVPAWQSARLQVVDALRHTA